MMCADALLLEAIAEAPRPGTRTTTAVAVDGTRDGKLSPQTYATHQELAPVGKAVLVGGITRVVVARRQMIMKERPFRIDQRTETKRRIPASNR